MPVRVHGARPRQPLAAEAVEERDSLIRDSRATIIRGGIWAQLRPLANATGCTPAQRRAVQSCSRTARRDRTTAEQSDPAAQPC